MTDQATADNRTQYWKAQIDAWQASGQSQQAFCKANDLNYPRFGYWLRKFRRQGMMAAEPHRASAKSAKASPTSCHGFVSISL